MNKCEARSHLEANVMGCELVKSTDGLPAHLMWIDYRFANPMTTIHGRMLRVIHRGYYDTDLESFVIYYPPSTIFTVGKYNVRSIPAHDCKCPKVILVFCIPLRSLTLSNTPLCRMAERV